MHLRSTTSPVVTGLFAAAVALASITPTAWADRAGRFEPPLPIRVLTLDTTRTDSCGTLDYNIESGNFFEDLRGVLLASPNFGSAGVVGRPIEFLAPVPRITGTALRPAHLVLLSDMLVPLDSCEQGFLQTFVEQGGGIFAFHNNAAFEVGPIFGASGRMTCLPGFGRIMKRSSAIVDGPFGKIRGPIPLMAHRVFSTLGPQGSEIVRSTLGGAWLASFEFGNGRAVLACDEEWLGSGGFLSCAISNLDDTKEALMLNCVAFVVPAPGFEYVPVPQILGDLTENCVVDGADLGLLRALWGTADALGDLNGDGTVDGADLGILLSNWG